MNKIIYWSATVILCIVFLFSASMYLLNYEQVKGFFIGLGFPIWLIYPLALLKIAGIIVLLSRKSKFLKELAYAGFLFNSIIAFTAHIIAKDGAYNMALIAVIAVLISWVYDRKILIKI